MVFHFRVFNAANALLTKITLNASMHHPYSLDIFKSKMKQPGCNASIRMCLILSFPSPGKSVILFFFFKKQ